ncbi:NADPH-dependent aldo-keto reductase, chloroplastic isoform X3 [Manihot esculenta]|uniref:NADPH-dependent aldo-keto reductase, chloroplastic isoform X3 n=1 Tax=Manihot esculenta TaxID=3983 RepID=UPI000B5D5866|nr:NADPH-dependent aldo-keto reductase, chloroplastic isoform X3 [Manihot esculenta]
MAKSIRYFELKTGAKIPSIGLGTWKAAPDAIVEAITAAVKVGYRHIDCAQMYGNEKEIHWPVSMKKGGLWPENLTQPDITSTWRAVEAIYDSGKARAIGVSNFSSKKLENLLAVARVPPAVNQVECHPVWQQEKLHAFCKSKGVHLSGYIPLGSPGSGKEVEVLKHPVLKMVAEKLGKTPAQVALRWGLQMGHSVLPKSTNDARIRENFDVFDWSIPEDLFSKFSEIGQERLVKGFNLVHETYGAYKTIDELWDGEL